MGQNVRGGVTEDFLLVKEETKVSVLTVQDVKVVERIKLIDIPKFVVKEIPVEVKIYNKIEEPTTKYIVEEKETVKFNVREEETIKYVPKEIVVEKPTYRDVEFERPILKDVTYEKPVVSMKTYDVTSVKDVELVKELAKSVVELVKELVLLKKEIVGIKGVKLVEEVVKVPKIEYVTTQVERIEWVPVKREVPVADKD